LKRTGERETVFDRDFLADLTFWVETDRKIALRIYELVEAARRDPFQGVGKPELLRGSVSGYWSRRINQEHRLVYRVTETRVEFLQARYHY
jgi:toxin YoeB